MLHPGPLLPTKADQDRFVPGPEAELVAEALQHRQNVLLAGPRQSGKTSLLHRLQAADGPDGRQWVMVSGEAAAQPGALLASVVGALRREEPSVLRDLAALTAADSELLGPAVVARLLDAIDDFTSDGVPTVIAIDGVRPRVAHALFGLQRNEVWALPNVTWLLTCDDNDVPVITAPPADAFWPRVVPMDLPDQARADMLVATAAIDTAGEPIMPGRPIGAILSDPTGSARKAPARTPAEGTRERLLDWMGVHGPATASDPELQNHLGVSRQRVSQLLVGLAADGAVVRAEDRPNDSPGRSRALYVRAAER